MLIPYKLNPNGMLLFGEPMGGAKKSVKIELTALAFAEMAVLIINQPMEVAWHGVVTQKEPHYYVIEDIHVYPQIVSDISADTDQIPYKDWLMRLDTPIFNKTRMQGHSHADMPVGPSDKDYLHQSKIVAMVEDGMFYIFMIWNKSFHYHIHIFDGSEKILYTGDEVSIEVLSDKPIEKLDEETVNELVASQRQYIDGFYDEAVKLIVAGPPKRGDPK